MTAFDEILNAEKEALQSIEEAKKQVADSITAAKAGGKDKIATEKNRLESMTNEALSEHASSLKIKTDKIQSEVEKEVATVMQKFTVETDAVKKDILQTISQ